VESGTIPGETIPGAVDLGATLESGQSYCWMRSDGRMYELDDVRGTSAWYWTVHGGEVIRARQVGGDIEWESTIDAEPVLRDLLGLEDDLDAIIEATPSDDLVDAAWGTYRGLRIVRDPFFPCLISFICSAQMRVARIFAMQTALRETYGEAIETGGETYHAFPTPDRLAAATEAELRDLGLGYRAPYVRETAEMVASGELTREDIEGQPYEDARETLTGFVGVGPKVADCVLLFSLGYLEAVPLDTWIRTAIEEHYPECSKGTYAETSRAIRERFGGEYAGYAQTYVFHYLRTRD
jgi:N-glycosylase/DNA lyase